MPVGGPIAFRADDFLEWGHRHSPLVWLADDDQEEVGLGIGKTADVDS